MHLAKSNPKKIFTSIITTFIVSFFILISSNPCDARREIVSSDQTCFRNIMILNGAIEMYNMDHEVMMDTINDHNIDILVNMKYLISKPQSPDPNCRYGGKNITEDGVIYCHYHGDREKHMVNGKLAPYWKSEELRKIERKKAQREKRKETINYITIVIALIITITLIFDHSNKNSKGNNNNI